MTVPFYVESTSAWRGFADGHLDDGGTVTTLATALVTLVDAYEYARTSSVPASVLPSSCWACRALFDDDRDLRLRIFEMISEVADMSAAARTAVDEHFAAAHVEHTESWT